MSCGVSLCGPRARRGGSLSRRTSSRRPVTKRPALHCSLLTRQRHGRIPRGRIWSAARAQLREARATHCVRERREPVAHAREGVAKRKSPSASRRGRARTGSCANSSPSRRDQSRRKRSRIHVCHFDPHRHSLRNSHRESPEKQQENRLPFGGALSVTSARSFGGS